MAVRDQAKSLASGWDKLLESEDWHLAKKGLPSPPVPRRINAALDRIPRWLWFTVAGSFLFVQVVFFPWPSGLLSAIAGLTIVLAWEWTFRTRKHFTPAMAASIVTFVMLISAVASGVAGSVQGVGVANFIFKPEAALQDGPYIYLGHADGQLYLDRCGTNSVIEVNASDVAHDDPSSFTVTVTTAPTLWDVVFRDRSPMVGYTPLC